MDSRIIQLVAQVLKFYEKPLNEFSIEVWNESLKRFSYEQVKSAFNIYVQTSKNGRFAPMPSDIANIITGGSEDIAYRAWSSVERAIKSIGSYRTVIFNDPIIHRVIYDLGGWIKIAETETAKEMGHLSYTFMVRYRGYMDRGTLPEYPRKLSGREEQSLIAYGRDWRNALELVGDLQSCLDVYNKGTNGDKLLSMGSTSAQSQLIENTASALIEDKNNEPY